MSNNIRLITQAELAKHNTRQSCWCSLNNRKVYDVTSFLDEHPGGAQLILEYAGKDITDILSDPMSHEHSEAAYELLDESYLVAAIATEEEEKHLLAPRARNAEQTEAEGDITHHLVNIKDDIEFDDGLTDMVCLDDLTVQTDFQLDYKKHQFIDLNRPMLLQVLFGNFGKEFYLKEVHRPRHYGKGSAPIFGNFLEPLSKTPWYVVPSIWFPVSFYSLYLSCASASYPSIICLGYFGIGLFLWTLIEYGMHRFLFHIDEYLPDHPVALTVHFLLHGVHHYLPMDRYRLVMPPTLFVVLCTPFYKLAHALFPYTPAMGIFAGGLCGYTIYDVCHYSLHHVNLPRILKDIKRYHLEHHYKNYELGFGVTSPFWDKVFGTEFVDSESTRHDQ